MATFCVKTYFISNGTSVKIGKSLNVKERFNALQTASPVKLTVLALIDGDYEEEYHYRFRMFREEGEWFKLSEELGYFIQYVRAVHERQQTESKQQEKAKNITRSLYESLKETLPDEDFW